MRISPFSHTMRVLTGDVCVQVCRRYLQGSRRHFRVDGNFPRSTHAHQYLWSRRYDIWSVSSIVSPTPVSSRRTLLTTCRNVGIALYNYLKYSQFTKGGASGHGGTKATGFEPVANGERDRWDDEEGPLISPRADKAARALKVVRISPLSRIG